MPAAAHPQTEPDPVPARTRARAAPLDAGWLFLLAGLGLIAATVLVPAHLDLEEARFERDAALAHESHRTERIVRYRDYLAALRDAHPSLVQSLAETQLNRIPEGRTLLVVTPRPELESASVFAALEPGPLHLPRRRPPSARSLLERVACDERARVWMLAGGALCVFVGLLPAASRGRTMPA